MSFTLRPVVRHLLAAAVTLAVVGAPAGAQVAFTLYETFPATPPDPGLPFPGGAALCSGATLGTPLGFFVDFNVLATRTAMCPANPDRFVPVEGDSFGGRFTGVLIAPSAGTYSLSISSDDGDRFTVNGTVVHTDWVVKAGGPGLIGSISLLAGANPFVFDYFQGPAVGGFIALEVSGGLVVAPPPVSGVPEPGTWALLATGLVGVAGLARRRRAA